MVESLSSETNFQAVAWIPDRAPESPWDRAVDLAATWISAQGRKEGVSPRLVTNTAKNAQGYERLEALARQGGHKTPQMRQHLTRGPVLAFLPDRATLALANDLARGFSLVAVETASFPLAEWAAQIGAVNLLDGTQEPSRITDEGIEALDSAIFFGGRNGWSGQEEKQHAQEHLAPLVDAGQLTPEDAEAYALSAGVTDRGAARLRTMLDKLVR